MYVRQSHRVHAHSMCWRMALPTSIRLTLKLAYLYNKTMFLALNRVYYLLFS